MDIVSSLHLLRPQWLWLLLALPLLVVVWWWQRRRRNVWRDVVDAHLLPALIEHRPGRRGHAGLAWSICGFLLVVLALAGPAWRMGEQPLVRGGSPLVVAVDLSSAAMANDLPPSRLLQVRAKLRALLVSRREGAVGLVAFAGDAFVVAPVSDDAANIDLFIDALSPELMPGDGSRAERAIAISRQLLQQAGHARGDILLMTDHADAAAIAAAASAAAQGYRVSAIGVGTPTGAAYRRGDGGIAHAQLDRTSLLAMTRAGQGALADLSNDQRDLEAVSALRTPASAAAGDGGLGRAWRDEGYWLLLPLLALVLLAFRRGAAFAALLLCIGGVVLWPLPGQAQIRAQGELAPPAQASSAPVAAKGNWWRRADQVAHARLRDGVQAYRAGDFAQAEKRWSDLHGADAAYNRGNALAKGGQLAEAIAAYDEALRLQPGMEDALANREAVEAAMRQNPDQGKGAQRPSPSSPSRQPQTPGQPSQADPQGEPDEGKPADGTSNDDARPLPSDAQQSPAPAVDNPRAQDRSSPAPPQQSPQRQPSEQSEADRAQREQMQRALQESQQQAADGTQVDAPPDRTESAAEREQRQANEAWLRRIPDDPGGLLRARFLLEQQRRQGGRPDR